jgi:hypothetical protein
VRCSRITCLIIFVVAIGVSAISHGQYPSTKLPGVVVDDTAAKKTGKWTKSTSVKPYVDAGYVFAKDGDHTIEFSLKPPKSGRYHVLLSYSAAHNRPKKLPITVRAADGDHRVVIDQTKPSAGPYGFHLLGQFKLEANKPCVVTIATKGVSGAVIADAVQLLTAGELKLARAQAKKNPLVAIVKKKPPKKSSKKKAPKKKPAPAVVFKKTPAPKTMATLTPAGLDALLEKSIGGIKNTDVIGDTQFLCRASVDLTGRQPTPQKLIEFLADASTEKRATAIDRLLASPHYGENWANYWSDAIGSRIQEPQLTFLNYAPLKKWLADELNKGSTWDKMVFRIITARGKVSANPAGTFLGFHQGDKMRIAGETSRIFLGVGISCAQCHDHPFVEMSTETFHGVAAFFTRLDVKVPQNDSGGIEIKSKPKGEHRVPGAKVDMKLVVFGRQLAEPSKSDVERRATLAQWAVAPDNPYFAKAYVNRIWAVMMGRGFCEPVDEIAHVEDPLLGRTHAALATHFIASGYNTKSLVRLIAGTKAYQRTLSLQDTDSKKPFAAARPNALRGDQVFDSLVRAVALPNIKPQQAKKTGAVRFPPPPKSTRDLVNDAFGFDPSLPRGLRPRTMKQAMFMMSNAPLQKQIDASPDADTVLSRLLKSEKDDATVVRTLYMGVLARKPSDKETKLTLAHVKNVNDREAAFEDILWSLVNSAEFTLRR